VTLDIEIFLGSFSAQITVPKKKFTQLIIVKQKDFFMKLLMKIESFLGGEIVAKKETNCCHCTDCKVGFLNSGKIEGYSAVYTKY